MIKEFIPYEQALALKELGFDEPYYFATYLDSSNLIPREEEDGWDLSKGIIAPLYQQAFRWFRKNYKLLGSPQYFTGGYYCYTINDMKDTKESNRLFTEFGTYEQAELECLKKLIQIVNEKSI